MQQNRRYNTSRRHTVMASYFLLTKKNLCDNIQNIEHMFERANTKRRAGVRPTRHNLLICNIRSAKSVKKIRIIDLEKCITERRLSEFVLNSDNVVGEISGVKYSMKFTSIKTHLQSRSIMLMNQSDVLSITAIKQLMIGNSVLGFLIRILTDTEKDVTLICN